MAPPVVGSRFSLRLPQLPPVGPTRVNCEQLMSTIIGLRTVETFPPVLDLCAREFDSAV